MVKPVLLLTSILAVVSPASAAAAPSPKRVLVVGASAGARHASIPNAEQMLRTIAARSGGEFALTMMSDEADYPFSRITVSAASALGGFPGQLSGGTASQQDAVILAAIDLVPLAAAVTRARNDLLAASLTSPAQLEVLTSTLAAAESNLASARAVALGRIQNSAVRLSPEQVRSLASPPVTAAGVGGRGGRGGAAAPGPAAVDREVLAALLRKYLSAENLRNFDAVIFVSATGPLPLPDVQAFKRWLSEGGSVVGLHAVMDGGYQVPDPFIEVFSGGGRYASSPGGGSVARRIFRADAAHPAARDWPDGIQVVDEFFQFSRNHPTIPDASLPGLDRNRINTLLEMEYEGERLPVAWTRTEGRGRIFYTALGHRDDVLLPGTPSLDFGATKVNPDNVSAAYQQHVLQGIRWALGLTDSSSAGTTSR